MCAETCVNLNFDILKNKTYSPATHFPRQKRGRLPDAEPGPPNQTGERAPASRTRVAIAITVRPHGGGLVHPGASSPICPLSTL